MSKFPTVALPHPWLAVYEILEQDGLLKIRSRDVTSAAAAAATAKLVHPSLTFSAPAGEETNERVPSSEENSPWALARKCPLSTIKWVEVPSIEQFWLVIYALITLRPAQEAFRVALDGPEIATVRSQLQAVGLAVPHPVPSLCDGNKKVQAVGNEDALILIPRALFWQGAGSPFGTRAPWVPDTSDGQISRFPSLPLDFTFSYRFPDSRIFARHPVRPAKPRPGSVVYSRYVPHLDEHISFVALDWQDEEHVRLFNKWQNDPRVAAAWQETGTLEEHREYLRKAHEDQHIIAMLGRFNDDYFAYFEIYWAKEDTVGAYYEADDYDRGWHALVGEDRFRGPHRVRAWMSAAMHYMFLDDVRTRNVIGEPRASGKKIIQYECDHGFHIDKTIDFPHKRAALVICSRENYFRLSPFHWGDEPYSVSSTSAA